MKELKDYLKFYLGCQVVHKDKLWDLISVSQPYKTNDTMFVNIGLRPDGKGYRGIYYTTTSFTDLSLIKLVLRPLSDMTEEENLYVYDFEIWLGGMSVKESLPINAEITFYLLSKHFDLFGLIEAGLAIDKSTLKQSTTI